jgi:YaiO family outer membrane protein
MTYRLRLATLAVAALLATPAAHAELHGQVAASTSYGHVTNGYDSATIQNFSALFDVADGHKFGVGLSNIRAWGDQTRYVSLRAVNDLSERLYSDVSVGFSDRGRITAERRVSAMLNMKMPEHGLILGVGGDYYTMRGGASARALNLQAVKYLQNAPVVLQANLALARSDFNNRNGYRVGVAGTYGHPGSWTVTGSLGTARVHYELVQAPGSIADYPSWSGSVAGRYWVGDSWGVSAQLSHVNNRYYVRNGVEVGLFLAF